MGKARSTTNQFPRGWDDARVRRVLKHYEKQPPEEAAAEDGAAFGRSSQTLMKVPSRLVPAIRKLIAGKAR